MSTKEQSHAKDDSDLTSSFKSSDMRPSKDQEKKNDDVDFSAATTEVLRTRTSTSRKRKFEGSSSEQREDKRFEDRRHSRPYHRPSRHHTHRSSSYYNEDGVDDAFLALEDDDEYRQIASRHQRIIERNPHLRQNGNIGQPITTFDRTSRILQKDAPRKKYFKRPAHTRSTLHWGQRKLLFSEIEFLSEYGSPEQLVLYAGAAPGTHIPFLSELFPEYRFVLVDPSPFNCKESSKISIINDYFTDEIAKKYADQKVLFISDIRTADHKDMEFDENERYIEADQLDQMRWVRLLQPHKAMLKFRLPYTPGKSTYLDGDIHLPVWGPQSTTETRLIPFSPDATRVYDHTEYEEQMFYFNTTTRSSYYEHSIDFEEGEGLDHCYDCMSEIYILREYLKKFGKDSSDKTIMAMSRQISKQISETRTIRDTPLKINKYIFERRVDQHRAWRNKQHKKRKIE